MGKYIYLKDEQIIRLNEVLGDREWMTEIKDILNQEPKTLEELGWKNKNEEYFRYSEVIKTISRFDFRNRCMSEVVQKDGCESYVVPTKSIEVLEAILNKAKEIFKEEKE